MPFKRPAPLPHQGSQSGESSSSRPPPAKQQKLEKALPETKVYIVQAKLGVEEIAKLFGLAERHTKGVCSDAIEADVIITAIGMRRRLERHIPWEIAETKAVVTPAWLRDSVDCGKALPCGDYVAIQDLHQTTVKHCPDCNCKPCACSDGGSEAVTPGVATKQLSSPPSSPSTSVKHGTAHFSTAATTEEKKSALAPFPVPKHLLPPDPPIPTNLEKLNYMSRYACQRASPLVCPNQALVRELNIIRRSRALEGEERSALSYERAASIVKAYPHEIRSLKQAQELPFIGAKIIGLVEEFLDTGKITEAQTISASERFQTLSLFSSIYGIGPSTALRLYNLGLRSLTNLEVYYGVEPEDVARQSQIIEVEEKPRGKRGQRTSDESLGDSWIRVALGLRADLEKKIPRAEVEEMGRVVMRELDELQPGCVSTIVGGYRRGKAESNDVDIVFTHPDATKVKGLCKRFVHKLHERGMVTHVMHLSSFHGHNPLRTHHWDSLEKALTVFIMPPSSPFHTGTRRRLDLIFATPDVYWTAVIGWTGSIMFQRDIRQWAKDKHGMKFDSSGITRRYDSKEFFPKTEKEAFDLLGLEWVDPTWRNADL